jgi:Asp-tRNA(Asn)/Glu-tRNA(Gln) amidotransferase A subunit family amidase
VSVDLDLAFTSAVDMARALASREVSPVELVDNALARIEQVNPQLNSFCFVWHEQARAAARRAADDIAAGRPLGPLHGVPIALKDTTPTAGHTTTLGSYTHQHWVPERSAHIAVALAAAGAIVVGKTTTPEFAHAGITDSPLWGTTHNPWIHDRSPGGSSGGSGAAVAAGCVPLAEGSDMGGSVRIPASWCGVVGLKPSLGRIPMDVLPGLFDNLSHHGPLARTVDDARLFTAVAQGPDDVDIQSLPRLDALDRPLGCDVRGLRIALSVDLGAWAVHPEIDAAVRVTAEALSDAGADVHEVAIAGSGRVEELWAELWAVFMAAYYGHLVDEFGTQMSPSLLRYIEWGSSMTAVHYKRLEIERTAWWHEVARVFEGHDAILCPTMAQPPAPARLADAPESEEVGDGLYHSDDITSVWNLVGQCPAISVPCGVHRDPEHGGAPIGAQVVARRWADDVALRVGAAIEASDLYPSRRPLT